MSLDPLIKRLSRLDSRSRQREINALKLPFDRAEALREAIKAVNLSRRDSRRRHQERSAKWRKALTPVRTERKNVLRLLAHQRLKPNPTHANLARIHALEAYLLVLDEVLTRKNAQYNLRPIPPPPDPHQPWPTWVPTHIQERIRALFDAIPPEPGTRCKEPFTTTDTEIKRVMVTRFQPSNSTEEGEDV